MELILLLVLLGLSAAFSGSETAFFSLGSVDLARLEQGKNARGRRVVALLAKSHDLLSALLIGNLLVNTAASVVATSLCIRWFGPEGVAIAVPAITLALLMLGEITPKMLALRFGQQVALAAQLPLAVWMSVTAPLVRITGVIATTLVRVLPLEATGSRNLTTGELQAACDLAVEDGTLTETEGRSLARLLELEELEVARIMTPRPSVVTLRRGMTLKQLLAIARRAGFNRYPVLDDETERLVGLFHLKDLLGIPASQDLPLEGGLRELLYVPESKDVAALLGDMRGGGTHLAAVVDEHGDFTGIVTLADCLQALMGPVADNTPRDPDLLKLGNGRWAISGRTDLRALEEACGIKLPASRDYVTVAGFIMTQLKRIPVPGDRVTLPQARFTVLEMSGHRVDRLQVTRLEPDQRGPATKGGS